ncbi:DEAD/DEAH box helicase [Bacillus cytotoxicus]|uniref:DEAD-box ATP-dependent RNA helicase CshB n=2 Tax=Bacillus cytotoxicus TaxID=580165 RepID=A0AAX2CKC0_9BACI|nr:MULTISPECIES: DEAD/DEAH box helicase [Bacillus cereus group]ABS23240.1 DEAD/DEAH box helicase domain protein [Bacillus cytotoxicus NVH 391-98]AWC29845.1 ATP-dependent helicase [Bacillus cytotoxicus]AWC33885.1 ATP-dependent helicase [Bacillus cytotoxicus]AWC37883.1 ATP-dependent helicase [Bacillus cytotoxicus]AWC41978.1 ATP-dependent helicase [Bacillus cytotoxicus]
MTIQTFTQYNFQPFLIDAVRELRFTEPTEIQKKIFPVVKKGVSIIGQSQTGSGKTHAYLLPTINQIDPKREEVQLVITAPTRELAQQIYQEIIKLTKFCTEEQMITARCLIGGTDKQRSIEKLKKQPHIVVGTPGRIKDLIEEQALFVHTAETIIVDEADLMLDMGFIQDVDKVAARMPKNLQMLVFSATIPQKLKPFLKKYMENPEHIHINPKQVAAGNIEHYLVPSRHRNKIEIVKNMLLQFQPYLAIVFTNTKKMAEEVANGLTERGLKVGRIHGDLSPRDRKKMMKQIRDLEFQYIVATDLAARGIDIEGISHVINYEIPSDLDFFVHRVGRTARAGYSGIAVTIYDARDEEAIDSLEKQRNITFKHVELRNGEWIDLGERNRRQSRKKPNNELDIMATKVVKKPKKVKPGYKKKLAAEREKVKKKYSRKKR